MTGVCVIRHGRPTAALVVALCLAAAPAHAQVVCGATVGPGGTTTLTADLGPCDGGNVAVFVDSATLDLAGHTVSCADTDGDGRVPDGVGLVNRRARVRNGIVLGCRFGVVAAGDGKHRVEGITATGNAQDGIFVIEGSKKNKVSGNNTSGNLDEGIQIEGDKNTVTGNTATGNGDDGINVVGGDKNKLSGNTASGNGEEGFDIVGTKNTLRDNTATGNGTRGIDVDGTKNKITGNTASGNIGGPDAIDVAGPSGCRRNKWRGNTFGTRFPDCLK
jgi:parallel beta-helix repeat protein